MQGIYVGENKKVTYKHIIFFSYFQCISFLVMNVLIQLVAYSVKRKKHFFITVILLFLLSLCIQIPDYVPFPNTRDYNIQIKGKNN